MSLPISTSYTLRFPRYRPDKVFSAAQPPTSPNAHPDTMGENNTRATLKGCGLKRDNKTSYDRVNNTNPNDLSELLFHQESSYTYHQWSIHHLNMIKNKYKIENFN